MASTHLKSDHVRVRVLGATEITVGTRRVGTSTEALFALTLYLTTRAGERLTRAEVLDTFWPSGGVEARRHALRQMLYRLRQKGFRLAEEGEHLRLEAEHVDSDLRDCISPLWPESASAEAVEAALALGPTFSSRLPSTFLEWFEGVRTMVSHQARKAAMRLISTSRTQGRWSELERWSRAVLRVDPLNEEATLALAEAASMSGAKTLALEILDSYISEVSGVDASVGKPAQQLRKRIAERRASWAPNGPREVALIGREAEMSVLTQAIETTISGQSRSVLVVGPSGYGKSRLLAEAREFAALRGVRCVGVRAEATLSLHPASLARALAKDLSSQPGAAAVDPHAMRTLRSLIIDGTNEATVSSAPVITAQNISSCLLEVIRAIADEARLLITLDDLHLADDVSLGILVSVLSSTGNSRCSIISAGQQHIISRLPRSSHGRGFRTVTLAPLSNAASQELASATASAHHRLISVEDLGRIARRSDGHPLFARELALTSTSALSGDTLPGTLADLVLRSLSALTPSETKTLRIITLLAESATAHHVRLASGLTSHDFLDAIETLSRDGVIHYDDTRTLRLHDSWRDAVLSSTPDATIATLALDCATCLEASTEAKELSVNPRLATLYRVAGEDDKALHCSILSIDGLLAAGLYDSAMQSLASISTEVQSPVACSRLLVREAVSLLATGQPALALVAAENVWRSRTLQSASFFPEHVLAVCVASDCHIKLDKANTGPRAELLGIARKVDLHPEDRARACLLGIRMASNATAVEGFTEFAAIAQEIEQQGSASPLSALALLIYAAETGATEDIHIAYERIRQSAQSALPISDRCLILRCSAHALRIAGDFEESVATAKAAYDLADLYSLGYAARLAAELLCNLYLDFELLAEARQWFEKLILEAEPAIASTASSREHTRDRLEYMSGQLQPLTDRVSDRIDIIGAIGFTQGKASELALAGAVLSSAERFPEAADFFRLALAAIAPFIGRHSADFALDLCLGASPSCAVRSEAERISARHVAVRCGVRKLRFAPAFSQLREFSDEIRVTTVQ